MTSGISLTTAGVFPMLMLSTRTLILLRDLTMVMVMMNLMLPVPGQELQLMRASPLSMIAMSWLNPTRIARWLTRQRTSQQKCPLLSSRTASWTPRPSHPSLSPVRAPVWIPVWERVQLTKFVLWSRGVPKFHALWSKKYYKVILKLYYRPQVFTTRPGRAMIAEKKAMQMQRAKSSSWDSSSVWEGFWIHNTDVGCITTMTTIMTHLIRIPSSST